MVPRMSAPQRLLHFLMTILGFVLLILLLLPLTGCDQANSAANGPLIDRNELPTDDEIREQLDKALDLTFARELDVDEQAAWQILHGALAFGRDFQVNYKGNRVSAVDHILQGGPMQGWTVQQGFELSETEQSSTPDRRYGLRALLEEGSKAGQGHADQWFAVLAQCELPPTQAIEARNRTYLMEDYLRQIQLEVHRNELQEYSWTLIGLTTYLDTDAEWHDIDGGHWSIEQLVEIEADHEIGDGACGGTHRLIGLSMALNQRLAQERKLSGPWLLADERVRAAIENARKFQNPDGSFSSHYVLRPGTSPDLAQNLGTTGHVLEFLAVSMTAEELQQLWVKRAVLNLCDLFQKTKAIPLECGALYHAAHGLALYRERVFGEREYAAQ